MSVGVGFVAAIGGGVAVAVISIVAGLGLIAAGLLGGPRWLILPAMVLVLPLAVVSAADLDLRGGVGQREYRPTSVADLRPEYRLGMGQIDLDLRNIELPAGRDASVNAARRARRGARARPARRVRRDRRADRRRRGGPPASASATGPTSTSTEPVRELVAARAAWSTRDVGVGHLQIDREASCA